MAVRRKSVIRRRKLGEGATPGAPSWARAARASGARVAPLSAPVVERLGDGRWLARVAHPFRKSERVRLYGSSPAQVLERARDVRLLRARWSCGEVALPAALVELERLQGGAARLTVARLWLPYVSALREPWRSKVRGIWYTRLNQWADFAAAELTPKVLEDWWVGCVRSGAASSAADSGSRPIADRARPLPAACKYPVSVSTRAWPVRVIAPRR